jgi:hypothetical protein
MKRSLSLVTAVALGCGGSGGGVTANDAGNGGDAGGDGSMPFDGTIKLTLANRPTNANLYSFVVAYQDGSAPWQLAPDPTGDVYTIPISAPSYGVAYMCIGSTAGNMASQQRSVTTAHFAVGERTSVSLDVPPRCSDRMQGSVMLSGNITNRPSIGVLVVQFGGRTTLVGAQTGNFTMQVPPGTRDLIVTHVVSEGNGDFYVDEAVVIRDVAVTANTTRGISFSSSQKTEFFSVDPSGAPSNARIVASTTLYTANGTTASLVREAQNWETQSLGDVQMLPTDIYDQSIAVSIQGAGATLTHATAQPAEQTFVAPAPLGQVMTTVPAKNPYITLQSSWPAYTGAVGYLWNANQATTCSGNVACTTVWSAFLSPGVVGASPAYLMPDLSALTGWKTAFELGTAPIVGSVTAVTSSAGAADFPTGIPAAGTDRVFVRSDYGISP